MGLFIVCKSSCTRASTCLYFFSVLFYSSIRSAEIYFKGSPIIYYSPMIFQMAGIVSNTESILPAIIIGAVNVLACFVSVILLDKVGRRKLYMIGISGMIPSLALLSACFFFRQQLGASFPYFAVLSIVCFIIFIAISLAPLG